MSKKKKYNQSQKKKPEKNTTNRKRKKNHKKTKKKSTFVEKNEKLLNVWNVCFLFVLERDSWNFKKHSSSTTVIDCKCIFVGLVLLLGNSEYEKQISYQTIH